MSTDSTRHRVLEAAGEVFARVGFRTATIRQIVDRAGANLSAVNYHFRDKETLYAQVLDSMVDSTLRRHPVDGGVGPEAPPEQRLAAFVHNLLCRALGVGLPDWHGQLMAREMLEPTPIFNTVVERVVRPVRAHLEALVGELLGCCSPLEVSLCVNGIIAQCLFYKQLERMGPALGGTFPTGEERIAKLADHITRFSLAGLTGLRKESP